MDHNQAFENRTFDNQMEALAGQAVGTRLIAAEAQRV